MVVLVNIEQQVANKAYNGVTGNRQLGNGDYASGDGWKYRGRGLKQLTGLSHYTGFTADYNQIFQDGNVDFVNNPDLLLEAKYAIRSAVYFWLHYTLYSKADVGITHDASFAITEIINRDTSSYNDRYQQLLRIWRLHVFEKAV